MMPFSYCTIAPGAGHASRQPGSSQCRHESLRMSQASPPSSRSTSLKRMRSHVLGVRSSWLWYPPKLEVSSTSRSFHSLHAISHALHPMHRSMSTSFDTSTASRLMSVDDVGVSERLRTASPSSVAISSPLSLFHVHEKTLVLGRVHGSVTHVRREKVGHLIRLALALARRVMPVHGDPDLVDN